MMSKIWDCFTFFCETELLQLRIEHLWNKVDYFVISECDRTHQNKPKDFLLPSILDDQLAWAKEKIIPVYCRVDYNTLPETKYPNVENVPLGELSNSINWRLENWQRNELNAAIANASEDDIIMIGDLDEIPNEKILPFLRAVSDRQALFSMIMSVCPYYLDIISYTKGVESWWAGTVFGKKKYFTTAQDWRERREIETCDFGLGYHFSWLEYYMQKKYNSTAHGEIADLHKLEEMQNNARNLVDLFQRENYCYHRNDINNDPWFPKTFLNSKDRFPFLFYSG